MLIQRKSDYRNLGSGADNNKRTQIIMNIPLSKGTYFYVLVFDTVDKCWVHNDMLDTYSHYKITGLELRAGEK